MKTTFLKLVTAIFTMSLIFGCDSIKNANNSQKGAVIGGASGAAIGGVIGNNVGDGNNTVLGAIIGGVVGGAAGAYIGNRMDKQAQDIENTIPGAEVTRVGEGINVTFDETSGVYFASESYSLNSQSEATLQKLADIFREYPKSLILVEGHTDNTGSDSYNMKLSENRAKAVTNFLVNKGISAGRFTTKWYGEEQPKYDNSTAEGRSNNRRVELAIIASEELKQEASQKTD